MSQITSPTARSLRALAVLLAGTVCALPTNSSSAAPISRSIVVDGVLDDWTAVLTNPANTAWDGDASDPTCLSSTDADCPLDLRGADLASFSWTWDADAWYFLADFQVSMEPDRFVIVFVDADRDGRMRDGEPVIVLRLRDDQGTLDLDLDD